MRSWFIKASWKHCIIYYAESIDAWSCPCNTSSTYSRPRSGALRADTDRSCRSGKSFVAIFHSISLEILSIDIRNERIVIHLLGSKYSTRGFYITNVGYVFKYAWLPLWKKGPSWMLFHLVTHHCEQGDKNRCHVSRMSYILKFSFRTDLHPVLYILLTNMQVERSPSRKTTLWR